MKVSRRTRGEERQSKWFMLFKKKLVAGLVGSFFKKKTLSHIFSFITVQQRYFFRIDKLRLRLYHVENTFCSILTLATVVDETWLEDGQQISSVENV